MKADLDYIELAIKSLKEMLGYINGKMETLSEVDFLNNIMMRNAMLMNLIVVGEALGKVSLETQLVYPSKNPGTGEVCTEFLRSSIRRH